MSETRFKLRDIGISPRSIKMVQSFQDFFGHGGGGGWCWNKIIYSLVIYVTFRFVLEIHHVQICTMDKSSN